MKYLMQFIATMSWVVLLYVSALAPREFFYVFPNAWEDRILFTISWLVLLSALGSGLYYIL